MNAPDLGAVGQRLMRPDSVHADAMPLEAGVKGQSDDRGERAGRHGIKRSLIVNYVKP